MRRLVVLASFIGMSISANQSWAIEKIFFASNRPGAQTQNNFHIWMMNTDKSKIEQLTFGETSARTRFSCR